MADHKNCKRYVDCGWQKEIHTCPENCIHFRHKDEVVVVRCKECKHWQYVEDGLGDCTNPRFHLPGHPDPTMEHDGFCSCGERGAK